MFTFLLAAALSLPNSKLTPGVVRHDLTLAQACAMKWGQDKRAVTETMKKAVFAAYGIPWAQHAHYEIDHLVPRELLGKDDVKNLWPQPGPGNKKGTEAHEKDLVENATRKRVCAGGMPLGEAQRAFMTDWRKLR